MSKLFIVYRTDRIDGQIAAIREATQNARACGASVGFTASVASASTAMTTSATTGASA